MGSQTIRDNGFPLGQIKGNDYSYFPGAGGGMGGGPPAPTPATFRYMYWPIKINPFSVRNNKLVLLNQSFKLYDSATLVGDDIVVGASLDYDVLVAQHAPVGDSIAAAGVTGTVAVPGAATFPTELVFDGALLPQPAHVGYERRVWVILDLRSIGRYPVAYNDSYAVVIESATGTTLMDTQVIDFEERI